MSKEKIRYILGDFSPRFVVRRTDGKKCRKDARYMVLDGSGADPHAKLALQVYAASVRAENPNLAAQLDRMLAGEWPACLAQHNDAE